MLFKVNMLKGVMSILPKVKGMIFSDGKFAIKRSLVLVLFFILLGLSYYFLGADTTELLIESLDEISDVIGYQG